MQQRLLQVERWNQVGQRPLVVLNHSVEGEDSYPIVNPLHASRTDLTQVREEGKVSQLTFAQKIHFIDSTSFFAVRLADQPKTLQ